MEHMKMHTLNKIDENVSKIAALFPNCVTEAKADDGSITKKIDFDMLKQELSNTLVEGREERYQFTWPDKKQAILTANAPIKSTLRPIREDETIPTGKDTTGKPYCSSGSVDFDNTQNLYIEGDNLEALKLLQETYLGKIKMIYIDPPYNTGNDFVYEDDFAQDAADYIANSGQTDEEGNRLVANTESNGRFHTDWLNMMYPRLKLARDLLSDDGVIFISIDDCEQTNIKKLCDEIFGESNFVANILREAIRGGSVSRNIRKVHDYVLCYARNIGEIGFHGVQVAGIELNLEDEYGKYAKGRELNKWGAGSRREDSPSMFYPIPGPNGEDVYPIRNDGSEGRWRLGKETMKTLLNNHNAIFEPRGDGTYIVYEKLRDDSPREKQFTTWFAQDYLNSTGTEELKSLFQKERAIFDFSKPTSLLKALQVMSADKEAIILDFFSGSATTAHAVMQLNAEDGGKRKFIMVQLPEVTDDKSEAYKAGYKNICEIGKERIRRAGKKIKEDSPLTTENLDIGFRVLKIDSSNMEDVYYSPDHFDKTEWFKNNIKSDRTGEDLLFQTMLDLGILLSSKIETKKIKGKTVFCVEGNYLMACFDNTVDEATITEIAKEKPYYFIMRDPSGSNDGDSLITNFEQIFTTYSPDTVRKVL